MGDMAGVPEAAAARAPRRARTASTLSSSAAASRTSPRGSHGAAHGRRRRPDACAARDGAPLHARDRHRVPARRGVRRSRAAAGCVLRPRPVEYGASIWADPQRGSRRLPVCCVPAAGSFSLHTRRSRSSASPRRGPMTRAAAAAAIRHAPLRLAERQRWNRVLARARRLDRLLRANGFASSTLIEFYAPRPTP